MSFSLWFALFIITASVLGLAVFARLRAAQFVTNPKDERAAELLAAGLLPLVDCPRDCDACLRCLLVDRCVIHRLLELGLTPGTQVRVVQDSGGPMLLAVRGSRVALGRGLAERLWVEIPALEPADSLGQ